MTFENLIQNIPGWLSGDGPESEIVISSRARLARNVAGIPYAHRAENEKLGEVVNSVLDSAHLAGFDAANFFRNEDLEDLRKKIFIERKKIL